MFQWNCRLACSKVFLSLHSRTVFPFFLFSPQISGFLSFRIIVCKTADLAVFHEEKTRQFHFFISHVCGVCVCVMCVGCGLFSLMFVFFASSSASHACQRQELVSGMGCGVFKWKKGKACCLRTYRFSVCLFSTSNITRNGHLFLFSFTVTTNHHLKATVLFFSLLCLVSFSPFPRSSFFCLIVFSPLRQDSMVRCFSFCFSLLFALCTPSATLRGGRRH
ncbi:hypothetical protein ABB37_00275 [Leptomonas pyrrhocoris]|uniref:Uncharacterized protein n=1 Tax=Leptomonas pyrrhocoris TaxID=157538 RepID=A0A0N0VHW7_LEPPY|nr:hypothetical protein ABB37_00275 [Leptomonas pyrrhocoris]KPA85984.1 hypothetical protein ABB37_00275 [Leptomonas pyrrhocoris]|eukprot:XP_015664423.1 hypothetical protein ABB37_00275 [Leptomonas pyrrhocoris]